ncbi:MAG: hypothetical protein R3E79_58305 [Caldilineaceae bacterium]
MEGEVAALRGEIVALQQNSSADTLAITNRNDSGPMETTYLRIF